MSTAADAAVLRARYEAGESLLTATGERVLTAPRKLT